MSSIVASGAFGAISGSSIATAASMTRIAYPEIWLASMRDIQQHEDFQSTALPTELPGHKIILITFI